MSLDYNAETRRRRRRTRRLRGYRNFALCAAAVLLLSLGITKLLERGQETPQASSAAPEAGTAQELLAPLPMAGDTSAAAVTAAFGPALQQAGAYTLVSRTADVVRLPARGQVDLSYFSDAAFLGDSLTEGFTEYNINLSGALICGYVGIGPEAVVNRTTMNHAQRGSEVILDVLAANQPKKVYILLGTNTLTAAGTEDKFLAYYSQMLDTLRQTLGDSTILYVESIPPVRPEVKDDASHAGLDNTRLKTINTSLAALAEQKGCYYIDLWEAMADADGNLNADYAAADGIHFTAGKGYTAWVNYLRSHTVYAADNEWTPGTAFAG